MASVGGPHRTLICVPIRAPTPADALAAIAEAKAEGADLAELRLDLLPGQREADWRSILRESVLPLIFTYRAQYEGGQATCTEKQRLDTLLEAEQAGVAFVDVELKVAPRYISRRPPQTRARLIVSHHELKRALTRDELSRLYADMAAVGADIPKMAMMAADSPSAVADMLHVVKAAPTPCIGIVMGVAGWATRILAPKFGAFLTFAALRPGAESAPGQLSVRELLTAYSFRQINSDTALYGVIGNPVAHSMSPVLHNTAFAHLQINARYVPIELHGPSIPLFIRFLIQLGFEGLSVTIPAKVDAMDAVDVLDPITRKIGAINTVSTSNIYVSGHNTDWSAALSAVAAALHSDPKQIDTAHLLQGKTLVCLGAGGTSRALVYGALEYGVEKVVIVNRTVPRAEALVKEIDDPRVSAVSLDKYITEEIVVPDILMNATSIGLSPRSEHSPVPIEKLQPHMVVFDAVYNPPETKLLKMAKSKGCKVVSGLDMFVGQGVQQLQLWLPHLEDQIPVNKMRDAVAKVLASAT